MEKPVVGAVVVLPFPHSDLTAGKRRPALVVANLSGDDLIPLAGPGMRIIPDNNLPWRMASVLRSSLPGRLLILRRAALH